MATETLSTDSAQFETGGNETLEPTRTSEYAGELAVRAMYEHDHKGLVVPGALRYFEEPRNEVYSSVAA